MASKTEADLASLQRVNDRLLSTKNEDFAGVLSLLLPKLIPMINDAALADTVVNIVRNTIIARISMISGSIQISEVLGLMTVQATHVTDLTIDLIDAIINNSNIVVLNEERCVEYLLKALPLFELFSMQSNSICSYLFRFLSILPATAAKMNDSLFLSAKDKLTALSVFGDYLLDIVLLHRSISIVPSNATSVLSATVPIVATTSEVSSIQPGLSTQRVARITAKKQQYSLAEIRTLKLLIINSLNLNYLPAGHSIAISIAASCDTSADHEVVSQALYKVNGAMNLFHVEDESGGSGGAVRTLESLLSLCSASTAINTATATLTNLNINRSKLRYEIVVAVLKFVHKDMLKYLPSVMKPVLSIVYRNICSTNSTNSSGSDSHILITQTTLPLIAVSVRLLEELATRIDAQSFAVSTLIFMQVVKKIFSAYTFSVGGGSVASTLSAGSASTSSSGNGIGGGKSDDMNAVGDLHLAVRSSCYATVSQIALRNPKLAVVDIDLLVLLFQLLQTEDERVLGKLYAALESARCAHQDATNASAASSSTAQAPNSKSSQSLLELISRAKSSADIRQRLAAVQWVRALFKTSESIVLDTMVLLADDPSEDIKDAVAAEFKRLRTILCDKNTEAAAVATREALTLTLLHTVVKNEWVFRTTATASGGSFGAAPAHGGVISKTVGAAYQLLKTLNTAFGRALRDQLQYGEWSPQKKGKGAASDTSASNDVSLYAPDKYVAILMGTHTPVTAEMNNLEDFVPPELLSAVLNIVVTATASSDSLSVEVKRGSGGVGGSGSQTAAIGAKVIGSSSNMLFMNAQLIRHSVALLRSALLLFRKHSVVEAGVVQCLLSYLVLPDAALSEQIAQSCAALLLSGSARAGAGVDKGEEVSADELNRLTGVYRSLHNKLVCITSPNTKTVSSPKESDVIMAANAVRSLGALLETLLSRLLLQHHSSSTRQSLVNEVHRMYAETVSAMETALTGLSADFHQKVSFEQQYLVVAVLQTAAKLASRGYLLPDVAASAGADGAPLAATGAAQTVSEFVETVRSTQATLRALFTGSYSLPSPSTLLAATLSLLTHKPTSSVTDPKSLSVVTAAAVDALTRYCLASGLAALDLLSAVWSALLSMVSSSGSTTGGTEMSSVLRFAVAEGLVRLSLVELPSTVEESGALQQFKGHERIVAAKVSGSFTSLQLILLNLVETAVSTVTADAVSIAANSNTAATSATVAATAAAIAHTKSSCVTLLLVLVRQYESCYSTHSAFASPPVPTASVSSAQGDASRSMSAQDIKNLLSIFLCYMREKDAFVQDVSCLGICHLYHMACRWSSGVSATASVGAGVVSEDSVTTVGRATLSLAEFVAYEVTVVLTRQKKTTQPAGYSVAGEVSAARQTVSESNANQTAATRPATGGAGVAGSGGATAPVDPLATAAAAAAAELGLSLDDVNAAASAASGANSGGAESAFDSDFGVYSTICKVCKKTGDSSVLFAVLALIRRDVTFGIEDSALIYQRYAAPRTVISPKKLVALLPMLFHTKYNPNPLIRDIMKLLWAELIPEETDQKALVLTHQVAIFSYCVSNLGSGVWRDREASCCALEPLLSLCSWSTLRPLVESLYTHGLNVLDDVRHSTRQIAVNFMKALATQLVRSCNPEEASIFGSVSDNLEVLLSLLVNKGMLCPSEEGRGYSLGLLIKVITTSSKALSSAWLERLVSVLIESMSALEPRTLQYMSFHTSRLAIRDEDLESLRVKHSQSSPMQEALTLCLQSLGSANIAGVIQNIVAQLRSGVGLATRVVAVESLCYLVERYPQELAPVEDATSTAATPQQTLRAGAIANSITNAFHAIVTSLVNSSGMAATLRKAMTSALGTLGKIIRKEVLASECEALVDRYNALTAAESHMSATIASCLQQIVSRSGDRLEGSPMFAAMWNKILVAGYIGGYDNDTDSQNLWQRIHADSLIASGCGNKQTALNRIVSVLVPTIEQYTVDLSWHKRAQGVNVLRDMLTSGALTADVVSAHIGNIVKVLLTSLKGRIWSHQGLVLETLAEIVSKCHANLTFECDTVAAAESDGDVVLTFSAASSSQSTCISLGELTGKAGTAAVASAASSEFTSTVATDRITRWTVSAHNLSRLLLHECTRGGGQNKEYALHAAKSIGALPWARITAANPVIFVALYSELSRHANIFLVTAEGGATAPDSSSSVSASVSSGSGKLSKLADSKARGMNSSALFGIRYGANTTRAAPVTRVKQVRRLNADVPVDSTSSDLESLAVSASEGEEAGTATVTVPMETDSSPSAPLSPAVDQEQEEVMDVAVTPAEDLVVTSVEEAVVAPQQQASAGDDSSTSASSSSSAAPALSSDPAYRMMFIETLCKGMPDLTQTPSDTTFQAIVESIPNLIAWTGVILTTEVWSVRRAAIQLIGVVGSHSVLSVTQLQSVLSGVVRKGLEEVKYVKVRVEALRALKGLLTSDKNKELIRRDAELSGLVGGCIRQGSSDAQPTVLEETSKVQETWLK